MVNKLLIQYLVLRFIAIGTVAVGIPTCPACLRQISGRQARLCLLKGSLVNSINVRSYHPLVAPHQQQSGLSFFFTLPHQLHTYYLAFQASTQRAMQPNARHHSQFRLLRLNLILCLVNYPQNKHTRLLCFSFITGKGPHTSYVEGNSLLFRISFGLRAYFFPWAEGEQGLSKISWVLSMSGYGSSVYLIILIRRVRFYNILQHSLDYPKSKQSRFIRGSGGVNTRPVGCYLNQIAGIVYNSMEKQQAANTEAFCILSNALCQFRKGDFETAHHSYSQALNVLPDSPIFQPLKQSILSLVGVSLYQKKSYMQALENVNQALSLNKSHEMSLLRRAKICLKLGQIEQGLADLESFIELAPDVEMEALLNRFEEAIDELEQTEEKYNFKKRISELRQCGEEQQELLLSFCKLKLIDRQSKIIKDGRSKKQSVYFGQQLIYPIEAEEGNEKENTERTDFTAEMKMNKIKEQLKEEEAVQDDMHPEEKRRTILKPSEISCIKIPSILEIESNVSELASIIDVLKVKDIDGKFIQKTKSEIKFRKSEYVQNDGCKPRKSILKARQSEILGARKSKLQNITNIDGKMLSYSLCSNNGPGKSNKSIESEEEFNVYGASKMSEDEVNSIVNNWLGQSSQANSQASSRKSALKMKSSLGMSNKEGKRRTVLFKQ